jgi:hypothetical protein
MALRRQHRSGIARRQRTVLQILTVFGQLVVTVRDLPHLLAMRRVRRQSA